MQSSSGCSWVKFLYCYFSLAYLASVSNSNDRDPVLVISYQLRALEQNMENSGSLGHSQMRPYRFVGLNMLGSTTSSVTAIPSVFASRLAALGDPKFCVDSISSCESTLVVFLSEVSVVAKIPPIYLKNLLNMPWAGASAKRLLDSSDKASERGSCLLSSLSWSSMLLRSGSGLSVRDYLTTSLIGTSEIY